MKRSCEAHLSSLERREGCVGSLGGKIASDLVEKPQMGPISNAVQETSLQSQDSGKCRIFVASWRLEVLKLTNNLYRYNVYIFNNLVFFLQSQTLCAFCDMY